MTDVKNASTTSTPGVAGHPNGKGKIRVVDDEGHLLFIYNPASRTIEYVPIRGRRLDGKGRVRCVIPTDELRAAGTRSLLGLDETPEFVAKVEVIDG